MRAPGHTWAPRARRHASHLTLAALATTVLIAAPSSAARTPRVSPLGGTWSNATTVPGVSALNLGHNARVSAISCPTTGVCSAGGTYDDGTGHVQIFVVSEQAGSWHSAQALPGLAALNAGGDAELTALTCPAAGDCVAAGRYRDHAGSYQAFVASQVSFAWASAVELPGTASLNSGGSAIVTTLSCFQNGGCSAGGNYTDHSGKSEAFVATMTNGAWLNAIEIPGTSTLNVGGSDRVTTISCPSLGSCVVAGAYSDGSAQTQAFVARMTGGIWQNAIEVPGTATLNAGGGSTASAVSCSGADDCTLVGTYTDGSSHVQAFGSIDVLATWHSALEVPGTAFLNAGGSAAFTALTCPSLGRCTAIGHYLDAGSHQQLMVIDEIGGAWQGATVMPGALALNVGGSADALSLACATSGNCVAVGDVTDGGGHTQALVDQEIAGDWLNAALAPGSVALNVGGAAQLGAVSCAHTGTCGAGGSFSTSVSASAPLVDTYAPAPSGIATSSLRTSIAALAGNVFTVDPTHGWVVEQSEQGGAVLHTAVIAGASEIVSDGAHLWVSSRSTNSVVELSSHDAVMRRVLVGVGPSALAVAGSRLLVANSSNSVSVVSLSSFKASAPLRVAGTPVSVAITGANLWVAVTTNRVLEYSLASGHLLRSVATGKSPAMMATSATTLYVANRASGSLTVVSLTSPTVRTFTQAGAGAYEPVIVGSAVFVTDSTGYTLNELSATSGALVKSIYGVFEPDEMVDDTGFLWVTSKLSRQIERVAALGA